MRNGFVDIIKEYKDFLSATGVSDEEIEKAEQILSLKFTKEFKEYLRKYGIAYANKHEFTGISKAKGLNVVCVTEHEREINHQIPDDWYVIEQLDIDGMVICQSSTGEIYQTSRNMMPLKICDSLLEYIKYLKYAS